VLLKNDYKKKQAGFQSNRSCVDQINMLHIIIEQSMKCNNNLYLMFIDFENAFDSINGTKMWNVMKKYGIPKHIIDLVKQSSDGDTCQVVHDGRLSEPIPTTTGVKQGCILSPALFLIVMDGSTEKCNRRRKERNNLGPFSTVRGLRLC
jgi:hypothetical protein